MDKKHFEQAMQLKFNALMNRIAQETNGNEGLYDHLLSSTLLLSGLSIYDKTTPGEYKIQINSYTAKFGYEESTIITTNDEQIANDVHDNLLDALDNDGLYALADGSYSM